MRPALQGVSIAVAAACAWIGPVAARASPGAGDASPSGGAAQGSERAPPGKLLEPLHMQVARAVFPRERWQKFVRENSEALAESIAEHGRGHLRLSPEFLNRLREQYEEMLPYEEMVSDQASELGSHYSPPELRRMLRFYTSPVGKKTVLTLPTLMTISMAQAQDRLRSRLPEALEHLKPFVEVLPPGGGSDGAPQGEHPDGTGPGSSAAPGSGGSASVGLLEL
ncbi:MAG TPA: DUF2059 domain-containing protein [Anaeromyxobacter sp.]|nr:DUF2059 domain-containing protein [Anaeromyxobacter sp.]